MAGTFNGNPLVTAAGTAVLRRLSSDPRLYEYLNALGEGFRRKINRFAQKGLSGGRDWRRLRRSGCMPRVADQERSGTAHQETDLPARA